MGTLYRALHRMLGAGLVAESDHRPAPELDDQRRRYYQITELGRRVARGEVARMESLVRVAHSTSLARPV
jgi:DNA-binding PadR family transcriptional regulator